MPRTQRVKSEGDVYHVIVRGSGRRIIFEDDEDRRCFMRMLKSSLKKYNAEVWAWCLMSNHVHLLLRIEYALMPRFMQSLTSGYATYFNGRHEHVGHVFAGRYTSVPVANDEQLVTAVRYIHFNPVKARFAKTCEFEWSSYLDYLKATGVTSTAFVLDVFGGLGCFAECHAIDPREYPELMVELESAGIHHLDDEAFAIAKRVLGEQKLNELAALDKDERDAGIELLRKSGLTIRQIERFTGIGRGVVSRVPWKE